MINENRLLASIALFRELYDANKDIYDVIAEFIIAAIRYNNRWSFTYSDVKEMLLSTFDFDIPGSVVKSVLKNRVQRDGHVDILNGVYTYNKSEENKASKDFFAAYDSTQITHTSIHKKLISYIELKTLSSLSDKEKEIAIHQFNTFLLNNETADSYSRYISSFIITNQNSTDFTHSLNSIKEGLLLYTGINYTSEINELGTWNNDLTIYLDTEILFSAVGFNGILHKEIFDEFNSLINEINLISRRKFGRSQIKLKYFNETEDDIDGFFRVAESIIDRKAVLIPSKTAMVTIVTGCRTKSDIVLKKVHFFSELKVLGVSKEDDLDYYKNKAYNIEDGNIIEKLKSQSESNNKPFNESNCRQYLKIFTKINVLRKGVSNRGFDKISHILLTGTSLAFFLANSPEIKQNEKDIPFATDIDFITNNFWFKLKKGFNKNKHTLKSFDVVSKAQVVLSAQINRAVGIEFERLTQQFKSGNLTHDTTIELYSQLRTNVSKPEEISENSVDHYLEFLNEDAIESHYQEQSLLKQRLKEGVIAKMELRKLESTMWINKKKPIKQRHRQFYILAILALILAGLVLLGAFAISLHFFRTNDSPLSLVFGIITVLSFFIPIIKIKYINKKIKTMINNSYRKSLMNLARG